MDKPWERFFAPAGLRITRRVLRMTSFILFFSIQAQANNPSDPCGPSAVGAFIKENLQRNWNQGTVRAWEEHGEFWSMPIQKDLGKLTKALKQDGALPCEVVMADLASFSARVLPKGLPNPSIKDIVKEAVLKKTNAKDHPNIISNIGTTLGIFEPTKGEMILIMYPAKIASAIARGTGTSQRNDLKEVLPLFPGELDIEYNFGEFEVRIFGGTGKTTMRNAADKVFSDLRHADYHPGPGSEKSIAAFDSLFPPDHHESFWLHKNGVLRIELEKLKLGQVRVNLHETRQR